MQLVKIGEPAAPQTTTTVLEMFQKLAAREAEMVQAAREKLLQDAASVTKSRRRSN